MRVTFPRSVIALILCSFTDSGLGGELPTVAPEDVGMSEAKLAKIGPVVQQMVDDGSIAGAVTIVARREKVVYHETFGVRDVKSRRPMTGDTIFRIYSMTKPVTSVAVMMLWEQGRLKLDDPISDYLPELKSLHVHTRGPSATENLEESKSPLTIRDLLRHTSGLTYGLFGGTPVDVAYRRQSVLDRHSTLADMTRKLSKIPLLYQPGTRFNYSVSTDVLGRLVEVISQQSLDEFFRLRIFEPLDMRDTGFYVRAGQHERLAANHSRGEEGKLRVIDDPRTSRYLLRPALLSGGSGLVSTGRDYLRFAQMLLHGGQLQGQRLLRSGTVDMMTSNQLPDESMPMAMNDGPREGVGFGLGFSVRVAHSHKEPHEVVGQYGWGGAASTQFWISPRHELIVIALRQFMPLKIGSPTPLSRSFLKHFWISHRFSPRGYCSALLRSTLSAKRSTRMIRSL